MNSRATFRRIGLVAGTLIALSLPMQSASAGSYDHLRDLPSLFHHSWVGFYGGVHASWLATDDQPNTVGAALNGDIDGDGDVDARDGNILTALGSYFDGGDSVLGGLHVGYNMQADRWLFGVEADISFGSEISSLASLRGRAGLTMADQLLIYGTAGVAFLNLDRDEDALAAFPDVVIDGDDGLTGFVVGGGFETLLSDSLVFGLEGLYYHFDEETVVNGREVDLEQDFVTLRARLSYRFGGSHYATGSLK